MLPMLDSFCFNVHHQFQFLLEWSTFDFKGAGTALLGKEGAMACTVAVESVIGEHYNR